MTEAITASSSARSSGSATPPMTGDRCSTTRASTAAWPRSNAAGRAAGRLAGDRCDLVEGPVQVSVADDQRRREPDHAAVGVLGQHAAAGQALARLAPGQRRELDAGPQAPAADAAHRG